MSYVFMILLFLLAIFLIVLVLIQRGKGGGLAGAFGGMGGQSAFGTKAGDLFTKITIGVAGVWILLCIATVFLLGKSAGPLDVGSSSGSDQQAPADTDHPAEGPSGPVPAESGDSGGGE